MISYLRSLLEPFTYSCFIIIRVIVYGNVQLTEVVGRKYIIIQTFNIKFFNIASISPQLNYYDNSIHQLLKLRFKQSFVKIWTDIDQSYCSVISVMNMIDPN